MRKTITKLLIAAAIIVPVLFGLSYIVDKGIHRSKNSVYGEWNAIYGGTINADLIINGSSRAASMLSPAIFDSMLKLNCYNIGMSGWATGMQLTRLRIYLLHNKAPKYVVQNVDLSSFEQRPDLFEKNQFIPYISDSILLNETNKYEGRFTFADLHFPFFKYNDKWDIIWEGIKSLRGKGGTSEKYKGYTTPTRRWDSEEFAQFKKDYPKGIAFGNKPEVQKQMQQYIDLCKKNNIKVIFVMAPYYIEALHAITNASEVKDTLLNIAARNNIPFLDYTNDTLRNSTEYFLDGNHLNAIGINIYNRHLANDLKQYIN